MNRYLEILGLPPSATKDQIRHAYLDLAKVWHPDRFGRDERLKLLAEAKFKEINEAYEALSAGQTPSATEVPVEPSPPSAPEIRRRPVWWVVFASACGIALVLFSASRWIDQPRAATVTPQTVNKIAAPPSPVIREAPSASVPPQSGQPALGEFRFHNDADQDCAVRVIGKNGSSRTVPLAARQETRVEGLPPDVYRLAVAYGDRGEYWMGPFNFYQTQDSKEHSSLRYVVRLAPH